MSGHVSSIKLYIAIFLTLMVLTTVTILVAYINLGPWNKVVALGIASFKATLVVLYFMHVRFSSAITKLFAGVAFAFLAILLALTLSDVLTRSWLAPAGPPLPEPAGSKNIGSP